MGENLYTYKYPRPSVATDIVVFGYDGKNLNLLLIERGGEPYKGSWALPGGFLQMDETVEEGALRELNEETNISNIYLEQFHVFSAVDRDPRDRVLSVAFFALVRKSDYNVLGRDDAIRAEWFNISELPPLAFDHAEIVDMAIENLRRAIMFKPLAFRLLDRTFTMGELQHIYELVNGTQHDCRITTRS